MSDDKSSSANDVLDTLEDLAGEESEVTVGDVTEKFGGRGFGPLIFLPALMILTPLGGIPTFPTLMAVIIALFAAQLLFHRQSLWLPSFLENRSVEDERVRKSTQKVRPVARWIDKLSGERLTTLTQQPVTSIAAAAIILLCITVPFSEVVPFAAVLPMAAIAVLGLALTVKDGIWMLVGLIGAGAALFGLWVMLG
jgi:hypothetical protein